VKNTWALVDKYPPYLVRCLAKKKTGTKQIQAISDEDIAILADIPLARVREIYNSWTWGEATVQEMRGFCSACDFDPESSSDRNRLSAYKNQKGGPKFTYLKKSPWWNSVFRPLIMKFLKHETRDKEVESHARAPKTHDPGRDTGRQATPQPRERAEVAV
jgi:hypothetical protein